jgi:hypothetical protein
MNILHYTVLKYLIFADVTVLYSIHGYPGMTKRSLECD